MPNDSLQPPAATDQRPRTRRDFLSESGGGLGAIALAQMLGSERASAGTENGLLTDRLHHAPRAKRVIQLFMAGAASHIDLFDHKPALEKHHGQASDFGEPVEAFQNGLGPWMRPVFPFRPYGDCGKSLSDPVRALGSCVDDIAFIHSMVGKTGVHSQSTLLQATGFQQPGFPGMGAWISYALGSGNDNMPTFVVLPDHRGFASNGQKNWGSAFLPAKHQGTIIRPGARNPIADLTAAPNSFVTRSGDRDGLKLLETLNRRHLESAAGDSRLDARIRSYELAGQMQVAAPEALDLSAEPRHVMTLYGLDHDRTSFPKTINVPEEITHFGRKCLVARRLLERGVRFVQIWSGCDNGFPRRNWDSHEDIARDHGPLAEGMAVATAGLIRDLKQRGLLDDTIILWTTEFGRMPSSQGAKGRDHNPYVFTNWLAGGGIKGGTTYGPSDQWGYKPADRNAPTYVYDVHATILHLLGIDHEQLTVRNNGIDRRLTDVHGHVIHDIIA